VRIVSHLPAVETRATQGRHRVGAKATSHRAAPRGVRALVGIASPVRSRIAGWTEPLAAAIAKPQARSHASHAHARGARHQSRVDHAGRPRSMGTVLGIVLAAAPWALVLFAPVSEGASPPSLVAQASASPSPPDYPPLLVVPLDSHASDNGRNSSGLATASGPLAVSSAGPASPPPLWLVNAQLREPASAVGTAPVVSVAVLDSLRATGIPRVALTAYINAATAEDSISLNCGLSWQVLAGIGYIESGHAHSGGSAKPGWSGVASPPIYGPVLDGSKGIARITDTDHGALDGNSTYDRAVGPMQFLPATWREYEEGASGHAAPDPQNIYDATLSAARYLCATGQDLRTADGLIAAVYGYNHSFNYVSAVLSVAIRYAGGTLSGGASALKELPALAQTASSLPSALPMPSPPSSATPSPTPSPMAPPTPPSSPSSGPSTPPPPPVYPQPSVPPVPTASPSVPALPVASPPEAPTPSPTDSPTGVSSPTDSPDPSDDPSPTDTSSLSPSPESSATSSVSPSVSDSTSPSPSATTGTQ
jgi:membrane-bound lytic murein transglycosylase B